MLYEALFAKVAYDSYHQMRSFEWFDYLIFLRSTFVSRDTFTALQAPRIDAFSTKKIT